MAEHGSHGEELKDIMVCLEEEQIEALEELAIEYSVKLKQKWDLSAIVRVAVGDFLTKMGKMT